MELKGAFKYLIQVVSDYIQDQELLSQLNELQSLIENKGIKDIELKRFILRIGKRGYQNSKNQQSCHCKTSSLQENLSQGSKNSQRVLQPIPLNKILNNVPINYQISTPRPHRFDNLFLGHQSERNNDYQANVKNLFKRNPTDSSNLSQNQEQSVPQNTKFIKSPQVRSTNLLELTKFIIQDLYNNTIELIQQISESRANTDRKLNNTLFTSQRKLVIPAAIH